MSEFLLPLMVDKSAAPNDLLPDPELLSYYRTQQDRSIWLEDDVNQYDVDYVRDIMRWNKEDREIAPEGRKPIKIYTASIGGDASVRNALVSTILASQTPVIGINVSMAYSAAFDIFVACSKRYTLADADFLIHKGSGEVSGNQADIKQSVDRWDAMTKNRRAYILERTKIPAKLFDRKWNLDWFIGAKEAVDLGIADKVVESLDEII